MWPGSWGDAALCCRLEALPTAQSPGRPWSLNFRENGFANSNFIQSLSPKAGGCLFRFINQITLA